ncbi:endonuclease/exonuclease/phosphatase family protein [Streptomyces actuosus]|uniref:Endonuclease/exonuclease/phosphatase family protein n=1 Tax=Streptomyces actuosus TaxID=1885 RepID=A0ABS2VK13_STRAS|nr:endonuclease/exonuclease/phosphatase family protein [Streptomyces actuosus]MBN0043427.1 endonuclease/exonuclease/phosphatase family protein [Streptomyces actuosus]
MDTATAGTTTAESGGPRRSGTERRGAAWTAGLLLAGVGTVVGCRAADTDGITPVPQLLAFLPWLLLPTGAALLLALLARRRTGAVAAVVVLGLLAWYTEPYGKARGPVGAPVASFRVLTSNVEFGRATGALADAVRREEPDVVFVEECDVRRCEAVLRREFAGTHPYLQAVTASGSAGSLVLSRFPLTGTAGVPGTMGMPGAVADVHGHRVRLQLAHPMPPLPSQLGLWRHDLGSLHDFAAADPAAPTVLAGDFNASQDHAAFRRILDTGLQDAALLAGHPRTPSWPTRTTPLIGAQIDHVLLSRDFSVARARFLDLPDTDHRALLVDVVLHRRR